MTREEHYLKAEQQLEELRLKSINMTGDELTWYLETAKIHALLAASQVVV